MALLQTGQPLLAEEKFTRTLELDPQRHDARLQRAFIWLRVQQRAAQVIDELESFIDENPDVSAAQFLYGMALVEAGDIHRGLDAMREAIELEPEQIDWQLNFAQLLLHQSGQNPAYRLEARSIAEQIWHESNYQNPAAARLLDQLLLEN